MQKELFPGCIIYFSSLNTYTNTIIDIIGLSVQVEAVLPLANLIAEIAPERPAESLRQPVLFPDYLPAKIPPKKPTESPHQPVLSSDHPQAEILPKRLAKASH